MRPDFSDPQLALTAIRATQELLRPHVHRTPLLECRSLSERAGTSLRLKCENLQRGGAFKIRGALAKALSLTPEERARGLITYSSGNHAQGVAIAASIIGTRAVVVMPEDVVPGKLEATRGYGAEVVLAGTTSDQRRERAEELAQERGLTMVPPFDDPFVVCGQATVGLEILEAIPQPGVVFVPIGGGGLISGIATTIKALAPETKVVGVEPVGAARAAVSLAAGRRVHLERADTVADGLRPLALGELNWDCVRSYVDEVMTVTDDSIIAAVELLLERAKLVVEPSGAIALAAALARAREFPAPAVAVLSGGNMGIAAAARALLAAQLGGASSR